LADLDITAGTLILSKDINLAAGSSFTVSGSTIVQPDDLLLTIDTNPDNTGTSGSVAFNGSVSAKNAGTDLVINTSASGETGGAITLHDNVSDSGGSYLQTLTLNSAGTTSGAITLNGDITTTGSITFDADVTVSSASVWSADTVNINRAVLGSARLTIIPKTSASNMTLAETGGTVNYGSTAFSEFTGDLWIGALHDATTAVSGNITFSSALTSAGNIYAIAGNGISINGQVSSTARNVTMVAVTGNIIGSGSGTHMSGSAIQLGALGSLGSSSQTLNVTGSSVQAWQGQNPMYVGYSGVINNTIGSTVLQFIPTASGTNSISNATYAAEAMKAYAWNAQMTDERGDSEVLMSLLCSEGIGLEGVASSSVLMVCQ
jgi:hypothetical protein